MAMITRITIGMAYLLMSQTPYAAQRFDRGSGPESRNRL
jgi:hypothetical protein